jgi:prolyl-tRNA editing enzyme YbaK/EbsC (Cys-tRNA(Pro) deacylase)
MQTRITKILDGLGISYRVLPHNEPAFTVEAAAEQRGVPAEEMIKSLLLRDRDRHYVLACVTGVSRVDPQAVRAVLPQTWKRLSFATGEEIQRVTGCVQGAIAPLGLTDDVPVIFDIAIARCRKVNISSGDPLAGLELDPQDLISAARALLGQIAKVD